MTNKNSDNLNNLNNENNQNSRNSRNSLQHISTLGIFTSFFIILLFFILLMIQNIYVLICFFIIIGTIILWHNIINRKKKYPAIILYIIGILIIGWQYRIDLLIYINIAIDYIKKKFNKNENFYTLFTPFSLEQSFIKSKYPISIKNRNKPLNIGYQEKDKDITIFLSKLFLSKANILTINIQKVLEISNECDILIIPAPIVNKESNLQFIANIQHQYLFCISTITSGVQNIHQLKNRRIGMPSHLKSIWYDIEAYIFPNGHSIQFTYDNEYKLIQDLKDFKLDSIFYSGYYPNPFLNSVILSEINSFYQLVPIMFKDENIFLEKNYSYRKSVLKLSNDYIPDTYLPTGLGRIWQTNYTPDYWTIGYDLTVVSKNLDKFTGYEIAKTIFEGRKLIAQSTHINHLVYIGDPFSPADIASPTLPNLSIQEGAKAFYIEKGIISYCNNPLCIETIGIKRCDLCDKKL
jgi:hypothetical protein